MPFKKTLQLGLITLTRIIIRGLLYLFEGTRFILGWVFLPVVLLFNYFIKPILLRTYLSYFSLKKTLKNFLAKSHNILHHLVTKKITLHTILSVMLLLIIAQNIQAQEKPSDELGRDSIIFGLVAEENGINIIEDSSPSTIINSRPETDMAVVKSDQAESPVTETDTTILNENTTTVTMGGLALISTNETATPHTRTTVEPYTVQPGDTITSIAKQFSISVNSILWANDLSAYSIIRPGDTLDILPFSGIVHTIKSGDTLATLAKTYQASQEEIIETNNLTSDETLAIGGSILIPGGIKPQPPAPVKPVMSTPSTAVVTTLSRDTTVPPPQDSDADLLWPAMSHRINQYYSWRHRALDIDGDLGDPVYASEDGVVEVSGWNTGGYGNYVIINHGNGIKTLYAHNSKNIASVGDTVARGDLIAYIGSTGRSTGPHIHYEVRVNGTATNPLLYTK